MNACVSATLEQTNQKNPSMCVSLVLVPTNTPEILTPQEVVIGVSFDGPHLFYSFLSL
jgi:hypothetical protein